MAKELTGSGGYAVGSEKHIQALYAGTCMEAGMKGKAAAEVQKGIVFLGVVIKEALEELHQDLSLHAPVIRWLGGRRTAILSMVEALGAVLKMSTTLTGKLDSCIAMLKLTARAVKTFSGATEEVIEAAAKFVERGTYVSRQAGLSALRKAANDGVEKAMKGDMRLYGFFKGLGRDTSKEFYEDVWFCVAYRKDTFLFRGGNKYELGSSDYITYFEKKVFGKAVPTTYSKDYKKYLKAVLQGIADTMGADVKAGVGGDGYVVYKNRERLRELGAGLAKLGAGAAMGFGENLKKLRRLEDFDHKVIEIDDTGIGYAVEAQLCWEKGRNVLYLTAHVMFHISVNQEIRAEVIEGFMEWNKLSCIVFGGQQVEVKVTVKANQPGITNFTVFALYEGFRPIAYGGGRIDDLWNWKKVTGLKIMFLEGKYSETQEEKDKTHSQKNKAKHEFGHMLGLGDIYMDKSLELPGVPYGTYPELDAVYNQKNGDYNAVMDKNGDILDNDIEMVIRAFQTGKRQNYQTQDFWFSHIKEISDVLGR